MDKMHPSRGWWGRGQVMRKKLSCVPQAEILELLIAVLSSGANLIEMAKIL
jgi:hypothetical protein